MLRGADRICCEDTRVTARLLARYGIRTPLEAYHDHNAEQVRPAILAALRRGERVALVSDAGTPLVCDPGYKLVRAALAENLPVTAVPGASAALTALILSGLPPDVFLFAGFLPRPPAARRRALGRWIGLEASLIFYEAPPRLAATLADMAEILGPREAAVARELTKLHEEVRRGRLAELADHYRQSGPPRGEAVIVVGPPEPAPPDPERDRSAVARRARRIRGARRRSAARRRDRPAAQRALSPRAGAAGRRAVRRTRAANIARRRRAERRGRLAEWLCLWHLRLRGWRIVARGWRCPAGEIDILARRGKVLAIIEVKSRGEVGVGGDRAHPASAPPHRARRRSLSAVASRSRRARPAIRPDAGGAAAIAAPLARRLARRRLANAAAAELGAADNLLPRREFAVAASRRRTREPASSSHRENAPRRRFGMARFCSENPTTSRPGGHGCRNSVLFFGSCWASGCRRPRRLPGGDRRRDRRGRRGGLRGEPGAWGHRRRRRFHDQDQHPERLGPGEPRTCRRISTSPSTRAARC